ncbi:MAG: LamB/YcsF family protein [Lunatimonas sp.]|uniref:LamB/YcsF family protein n=1 Tax=Lunatimonas sp. TaxID=2060141 RepID=UPI00263BBF2F|nr:LamB/YcsF family protein [Lunatimonas sp.]MCC5939518.1 LamB/YcsF family protein [Lunatimonas sp.]
MVKRIDVNADLGEEMGFDAAIMRFISSCSIACGGHAGNPDTIREAVMQAQSYGLRIGAHPSYPDPENFGRIKMEILPSALENSVKAQIQLVTGQLNRMGVPLHHVKFHGALYNEACVDSVLAQLLVSLLRSEFPGAKLYAPYASEMAAAAGSVGVEVWYEGFVDRRYHPDLTLVKRSEEGAVLKSWVEIREQVEELLLRQRVRTSDGSWKAIWVDTLCLHGDHPEALHTARNLNQWIQHHGMVTR